MITAFLPPRANTTVRECYEIPVSSLRGPGELEAVQAELTLQPRVPAISKPRDPVKAWTLDGDVLRVPRFYGLRRFGTPTRDERTLGDPLSSSVFTGTPTPVQVEAADRAYAKAFRDDEGGHHGFICQLPCGYGKTFWAVMMIVRLGRRATVMVHKDVIRDQWLEAFGEFAPHLKVCVLQGGGSTVDEDADVVVAMVLTLAYRSREAWMDRMGTVVSDEAHHMAAPVMNTALRHFAARNVIGLTATKERADGLTPLLHWCLGFDGFHKERDGTEPVRVTVAIYPGVKDVMRNGEPVDWATLNAIASHRGRNEFIADRAVAMRQSGRVLIVLCERLVQVKTLREMIVAKGIPEDDVGVYVGSTKAKDRAHQLSKPVVLSNYPMAREGLSKNELDGLIMASPTSNPIQCIGRVQRPCATKMSPSLVLDVCDSEAFNGRRFQRQRFYTQQKYDTQIIRVGECGGGALEFFV